MVPHTVGGNPWNKVTFEEVNPRNFVMLENNCEYGVFSREAIPSQYACKNVDFFQPFSFVISSSPSRASRYPFTPKPITNPAATGVR